MFEKCMNMSCMYDSSIGTEYEKLEILQQAQDVRACVYLIISYCHFISYQSKMRHLMVIYFVINTMFYLVTRPWLSIPGIHSKTAATN